jgi:acetyl-CoA carboxylase biotin carboxyl carrier protein
MDLKEIQNLIKFVAKSGTSEVKLETDDFKITIKTGSSGTTTVQQLVAAPPIAQLAPAASQLEVTQPQTITSEAPPLEDSKYITVKSPIIGTFYRRPSPDKPLFVEVGQSISEGDVLCVIEAMKLFNEIESEITGTIVKILVDDSSPVEFDQPLFLVDPS